MGRERLEALRWFWIRRFLDAPEGTLNERIAEAAMNALASKDPHHDQ